MQSFLYILLLAITSLSVFGAGDIILFLDMNNNPLEIKAARKGAKKAGDKLVVYPTKGKLFNKETAMQLLETTPFSVLALSGHDGGGSFSGDRGEELSKSDIEFAMANSRRSLDDIDTLMLIGCNTGNRHQVYEWRNVFPKLKLVAGYDGYAPLGDRPAGHAYIEDIIIKRDNIIKTANAKELKNKLNSLRHLYDLEIGLFAQTSDCTAGVVTSEDYYFRPLEKDATQKFQTFYDPKCKEAVKQLGKHKKLFMEFFNGTKEYVPHKQNNALKATYVYLTKNEHCIRDFQSDYPGEGLKPDPVLMMRFYDKVKKNFMHVYKDSLDGFAELFSKLTYEQYEKHFEDKLNLLKNTHAKQVSFLKNPNEFTEYHKQIAGELQKIIDKFLKKNGKSFDERYFKLQEVAVDHIHFMMLLEDEGILMKQYAELKGRLSSAKDYENFKGSERIKFINMFKNATKDELEFHKSKESPTREKFTELKTTSEKLLKLDHNSSRLEIVDTTHQVYSTPSWVFGEKKESVVYKVGNLLNSGLYSMDEKLIPFSWHDTIIDKKSGKMKDPQPVLDSYYRPENLLQEENYTSY